MSIDTSKLNRYKPGYVHSNDGPGYISMIARDDGEYVRLEDVKAITSALEQALTQQRGDAEPVAFVFHELTGEVRLVWYSQSAMHNPPPSGTKLYTTLQPSADAVREYDRELIARMLETPAVFEDASRREQARLLREADNLEADARTVVLSAASGEGVG